MLQFYTKPSILLNTSDKLFIYISLILSIVTLVSKLHITAPRNPTLTYYSFKATHMDLPYGGSVSVWVFHFTFSWRKGKPSPEDKLFTPPKSARSRPRMRGSRQLRYQPKPPSRLFTGTKTPTTIFYCRSVQFTNALSTLNSRVMSWRTPLEVVLFHRFSASIHLHFVYATSNILPWPDYQPRCSRSSLQGTRTETWVRRERSNPICNVFDSSRNNITLIVKRI